MDFTLTDEQQELKEAARAWLADKFPLDRYWDSQDYRWSELEELGWTDVAAADLGFVEEALLLEELGYALYPGPFLQHVTGLSDDGATTVDSTRPLATPPEGRQAIETLDVFVVKDGPPWDDGFELATHHVDAAALDDTGAQGRLVGVVREDVPRAEDEVGQGSQCDEVTNAGGALLGPLAEPDRTELRQRTDRLADALLDELDAGDEGATDRPQSDQEHAELALRVLYGPLGCRHRATSIKETHQRRKGRCRAAAPRVRRGRAV